MPSHPKPKVVKDPQWLAVVRQLPCWMLQVEWHYCTHTMGYGRSEASHLDGKSRDDRVLPMCGRCHRTDKGSWHHGQKTFCYHYGTTKDELIAQAEGLYHRWKGGQDD